MFKPFIEMIENVSAACRKAKRTFTLGFRQGSLQKYAETQKKELEKATPRSDKKGKHAADEWKIEYDKEGGFIVGFEITNPYDRIDWLEYGTPIHMILPKTKGILRFEKGGEVIFTDYVLHPGIKPMGFVRGVQDKMDKTTPSWLKQYFDRPIERDFE
jgi:hypothetical protein